MGYLTRNFLPCSFGGEVLPATILSDETQYKQLDLGAFLGRNSKAVREPEIVRFAESLRPSYSRIGAIGYCYGGGWAVLQLGARGRNLVDCISTAHPSMITKQEIASVNVPTQILAPEFDHMFSEELKAYSQEALPKAGVPFDYQYFPGLHHGFAIRGDPQRDGERKGMERAKNAASLWFRHWLRQG